MVPRCWYTFTRNRPMPGTPIAKSASLCSAKSFTCFGVMICSASAFKSSGRSGGTSSELRSPFTRSTGGRPTLRCKSDAFCWIMRCRTALKLNAGACWAGALGESDAVETAGLAIGVDPEEDLSVLHRMRVAHQHLAHDPGVLGLDLVHDLHRLDDAQDFALRDARSFADVRGRPWLGRTIERPHHRRLDLKQF